VRLLPSLEYGLSKCAFFEAGLPERRVKPFSAFGQLTHGIVVFFCRESNSRNSLFQWALSSPTAFPGPAEMSRVSSTQPKVSPGPECHNGTFSPRTADLFV
jgi:hypothetical protein